MKVSTRAQYAIVGLTYMRRQVKKGRLDPIRLQEISEAEGISLHYLEQLFRKLRIARIVRSVRGPGGGYMLLGPTNYKAVFEAVGEKISFRESLKGTTEASHGVVTSFDIIGKEMTRALENITV